MALAQRWLHAVLDLLPDRLRRCVLVRSHARTALCICSAQQPCFRDLVTLLPRSLSKSAPGNEEQVHASDSLPRLGVKVDSAEHKPTETCATDMPTRVQEPLQQLS